jgi:hypothetical protein
MKVKGRLARKEGGVDEGQREVERREGEDEIGDEG